MYRPSFPLSSIRNYVVCLLIPALFLFVVACGDDDSSDPEVDSLVGKYSFTAASLSSDFSVEGDVLITEGTDFTPALESALFESADCNMQSAIRLELRENKQVWYSCEGEGPEKEVQNGTWNINEARTELTLTLNLAGQTVPLKLADLNETNAKISGVVNGLPVPGTLFCLVNQPVCLDILLETHPVDLAIEFEKED